MVRFHGDGAEALENATLLKVPFPASSESFCWVCGSGTVFMGGQKAKRHPVLDRIAAAAAPPRLSSFGNRLTCKFLHQPAMRRSSKTLGGFERCITTPRWQMFFGGKKTEEVSRGAAVKRCRNLLFFFFSSSKSITVNSTVPSFLLYQLLLFHFLQITRRAFTRRLR